MLDLSTLSRLNVDVLPYCSIVCVCRLWWCYGSSGTSCRGEGVGCAAGAFRVRHRQTRRGAAAVAPTCSRRAPRAGPAPCVVPPLREAGCKASLYELLGSGAAHTHADAERGEGVATDVVWRRGVAVLAGCAGCGGGVRGLDGQLGCVAGAAEASRSVEPTFNICALRPDKASSQVGLIGVAHWHQATTIHEPTTSNPRKQRQQFTGKVAT